MDLSADLIDSPLLKRSNERQRNYREDPWSHADDDLQGGCWRSEVLGCGRHGAKEGTEAED